MNKTQALLFATATTLITGFCVAAPPSAQTHEGSASAIARLVQDWQSRILAFNLPVDDAKNWSRRNLAKFSRLDAERLSLAQQTGTLGELEAVLLEAPIPQGTRLDVLLATRPSDIMMVAKNVAKSSPATSPSLYSDLVFTAVTPCRLMDTRPSQGGTGSWTAGSSNLIKIGPYATGYATGPGAQGGSATSCGLDALAGAGQIAVIMAAVSTVSQVGAGYLTFYPQGAPNPGAASVSQWYQSGYVQTSFVLIPTDLVGTVAASGFTSAATDVIIDVVGYFIANAGNGNITLVSSTANAGNIMKGASSFIHNFGGINTFVGLSAGNFTMTGGNNNAVGYHALGANTTGTDNTAHGYLALNANTTGVANTALGSFTLFANSTGTRNTALGFDTLASNSTGSRNIGIGSGGGSALTTGDYNIDIGHFGVAGDANTIRLGDPVNHTKAFISGIRGVTTGVANGVAVLIDGNGQLGTVSSSRRVKDDIADMDAASSALMKLRPVTFHYKSDQSASGRTLQYGLIAEEVAEIYPGLVAHSANGEIETVMYQFLPSMLLNEYQKQQRTIAAQSAQIARQDRIVSELREDRRWQAARIDALEKQSAEIAELRMQVARTAKLLDRMRRPEAINAGLEVD